MSKLHECKRGLATATPEDYNRWWRQIEELEADNAELKAEWIKALRRIKELEADHIRRILLEREVDVLRLYGNKDCTAMADEVLGKNND